MSCFIGLLEGMDGLLGVASFGELMRKMVTLLDAERGRIELTLKVLVPVTSLCPCLKQISAYGAHNQRSHITVNALCWTERFWLMN